MDMTPIGQMKYWFGLAHQEVCTPVSGLSDEKIAWQPHPAATSIAFNAWHLARWADYVQSNLRTNTAGLRLRIDPRAEIWASEQLTEAWVLLQKDLGHYEAGNDLEEEALAVVDEEQFQAHSDQHETTPEDTVGRWLMSHLVHEWEHLGIIRYISGLYDLNVGKDQA